ncbi:uncharacterized protein LOC123316286 [Coccinella septempunctata]|uniref:uncharacterized protein LOC123316286 n=1 Tax=Coccinella septempunctata TaxID=41139 RepID=UPI001D05F3B2|nr:uncharacterized protein LOC123316286 [Coccinella septempunctata]
MDSPMDNIIIELRPRLSSVNFFINLRKGTDPQSYKINLFSRKFDFVSESQVFSVKCPSDYLFLENSLSCLTYGSNYIYFRCNLDTIDKKLGSCNGEFLKSLSSSVSKKSVIKLLPESQYKIQCVNCQQNFNDCIKFERILPLPSNHIDPSEWFCHKHENENKTLTCLNPKLGDLFYSSCYFHIHQDNLKNVVVKSKNIVCKRCLLWLGLNTENYVKSWFHNIQFVSGNKAEYSTPTKDVFLTISDIVEQNFLGCAKILFEQCSPKGNDYLFVWILEKNLKIFFGNALTDLEEHSVYKVLYQFENDAETVNRWMNDNGVFCVTVSKQMMVDALKNLNKYHKLLPESFSKSNGLYISYLLIPDD